MRQKTTYLIIGGIVYLIDISMFTIVIYFFPGFYIVGNIGAKTGGALAGFFLHDRITFSGAKNLTIKTRFFRYGLLWLCNMVLAVVLLFVFVKYLFIPEIIAKIISDIIVITIAFLVGKHTVFK